MEFAGHGVEVVLDDGEAHRADVEVGAFGQPASQQADGLLVGAPLPRRARITEVHLRAVVILGSCPTVPDRSLGGGRQLAADSAWHWPLLRRAPAEASPFPEPLQQRCGPVRMIAPLRCPSRSGTQQTADLPGDACHIGHPSPRALGDLRPMMCSSPIERPPAQRGAGNEVGGPPGGCEYRGVSPGESGGAQLCTVYPSAQS